MFSALRRILAQGCLSEGVAFLDDEAPRFFFAVLPIEVFPFTTKVEALLIP